MVMTPSLPLVMECCHLDPATSPFNAFRLPNSVAAVPTVSSDLQRNLTVEPFKDAEASLTNLFLTVVVKGLSPVETSKVGE